MSDGEVTALVARRGQDERVAVHIDGRRVFDLSAVVADRAGLRAGVHLTAETQQELIEQDAPYRARERALRLLAPAGPIPQGDRDASSPGGLRG